MFMIEEMLRRVVLLGSVLGTRGLVLHETWNKLIMVIVPLGREFSFFGYYFALSMYFLVMLACKFCFLLGSFYRIYGEHCFYFKRIVNRGDCEHSVYSFEDLPFVYE